MLVPTLVVLTIKLAVDEPALTFTADCTVAAATLLDRLIVIVCGAAELSVAVQVDGPGVVIVPGVQLSVESTGSDG